MGPNGSGKSNIIDALIFVLGEGRLKLVRASRLRDLVNVKAKDGEATVSLDIEADGKVYTITRTINKKGSLKKESQKSQQPLRRILANEKYEKNFSETRPINS